MNASSGLFRRALPILSGAVVAQGLVVLAAPVLTRLYTPEDFGVLATFAALFSLLTYAATLRYEDAVPVAAEAEEARSLQRLGIRIAATLALLVALTLALLERSPRGGLAVPRELWLLPVGVLAAGTFAVYLGGALRLQEYKAVGATNVRKSLAQLSVQVLTPLVWPGAIGLVLGKVVDRSAGLLLLRGVNRPLRRVDAGLPPTRQVMRRYAHFALFGTPAALVNAATLQVIPLGLVAAYGLGVAGQYSLANRVVAAPVLVLGTALGQAFISYAPTMFRKDPRRLLATFDTSSRRLLVGAAVLAVAMSALGLFGVRAVFGDDWAQAGLFMVLLLPIQVGILITQPLSRTYHVLERQKTKLWVDGANLALVLGALVLSPMLGATAAVTLAVLGAARGIGLAGDWWVMRTILARAVASAHPGLRGA